MATLHGLTIASPELALTTGLTIAQPRRARGRCPTAPRAPASDAARATWSSCSRAEEDDPREALARGREVLRDLLRALRLFGDGRVTLGALAWARVGGGAVEPAARSAPAGARTGCSS